MACKTSYELHHQFPKIAEEAGFAFNNHRPRVHIDWNKIRLIDLENLIRERKFILIEQHLNDVLDCVLESEFDVRILDEGVLKLFRLAQLAVEYQQFCRHYLDRSVYILRQEITAMAQELETAKKSLEEKEEELRKLKRRTRHTYKTPLPYGNDNIANMILKTLSNRAELFPSTSNLDTHHYNKCKFCDKVFLNQLYLKSHIDRRHADVVELPQKEADLDPNQKLTTEVTELKRKLKEMEDIIASTNNKIIITSSPNRENDQSTIIKVTEQKQMIQNTQKILKDAEVLTNNDDFLIKQLEEWKKDEQEKHSKEISMLRNEILETIKLFKEKTPTETNIMSQLRDTIEKQGVEIFNLKEELNSTNIKAQKENTEKYKEAEARASFWVQKSESQAQQCESLIKKLNEVANDAKESRSLAEAERERANKLEAIVKQNFDQKAKENITQESVSMFPQQGTDIITKSTMVNSLNNSEKNVNHDTLQKLHKRAQELLNMDSLSSSTSELSSEEEVQIISPKISQPKVQENKINRSNWIQSDTIQEKKNNPKPSTQIINPTILHSNDKVTHKIPREKERSRTKREKSRFRTKNEKEIKSCLSVPESPLKLVRAKLTEEVNNRLVISGMDPLKSRLSLNVFKKQRAQLQQQHELKSKKNVNYDKVRNAILTYLDENTCSVKSGSIQADEHMPGTKTSKRSFTSIIENVKSKALSLVKGSETSVKEKRKSLGTEVSKKAMALLKTPPSSVPSTPQNKRNTNKSTPIKKIVTDVAINKMKYMDKVSINSKEKLNNNGDDSEVSSESEKRYYNTSVVQISSKSMDNLLKSPARRPVSAGIISDGNIVRYAIVDDNEKPIIKSQSTIQLKEINPETFANSEMGIHDSDNSDLEPKTETPLKKSNSEENIQNLKQTKGVLKNASSISSLNKKKVLFDMDAIQMKSLSASPSQSITERSENNEKYELGLVNLDTEEWDISSIDSEHLQNDTKLCITTRTAPKIAELKKQIESQLARRNGIPTALVGSVDVLGGSLIKGANSGGSNTSLGSSILDESERAPGTNHKTLIKAKKALTNNDSDLEISEFSIEGLDNKNKNESF